MRSSSSLPKRSLQRPNIIVIVGPTASGKSALGIFLARKVNGEIVSADSRQVYRGMDIGAAKVSKREQKLVKHHLLDVADPKRPPAGGSSVAQYVKLAGKAISDIQKCGKVPIIVGGTGFYVDALVGRTSFAPVKPDKKLRARFDKLTVEHLFKMLNDLDPERARTIDRRNKRRLIRALEIVLTTGKPGGKPGLASSYQALWLGVAVPKEQLERNIRRRMEQWFRQGLIREVQRLRRGGVSFKRLEQFGLTYQWVAQYLQQKASKEELKNGLARAIVQYAKRQMTWFKRNTEIRWIKTPAEALRLTKRFLS